MPFFWPKMASRELPSFLLGMDGYEMLGMDGYENFPQ